MPVDTLSMANENVVRVATYNASLNRASEGELFADLSTPDDAQAQRVAEVIQRTRPDILLINEFDYSPQAVEAFKANYLGVSQNGQAPVDYAYDFSAPVNTGVASGVDLNGDGRVVTRPGDEGYADDALGFGQFPGQYGMLVLSRYPIDESAVRTFRDFLWKDMPDARLPDDPQTAVPGDYYSPEALDVLPLSSKSHWDVPIQVAGETLHLLASHPTPPTFDGAEDRNGLRNADEIRFWSDYVSPGKGDYIVDDQGQAGGLAGDARFVVVGDQNVDPLDGDSLDGSAQQLLDNARVAAGLAPQSEGAVSAAQAQGGANADQQGDPAYDTADFNDQAPGNLRVDYVLPSQAGLTRLDGGVFWPEPGQPGSTAVEASDHRLVYADLALTEEMPRVAGADFLGLVALPDGLSFQQTPLGGLSGLTRDGSGGYLAISDDRSDLAPARFYSLRLDLADGRLDDGDVRFTDVTTLWQAQGEAFASGTIDPEGIAYGDDGTLFISSEGDSDQGIAPFVGHFGRDGQLLSMLEMPAALIPDGSGESGVRNNLALESLTLTPDGETLFTATESALVQDGPGPGIDSGSPSRILQYDARSGEVEHQYVYPTEPGNFGLVEMLALDDGHLLALERNYFADVGNTIRLYEVDLGAATDINGVKSLEETSGVRPVDKRLVADLGELGIDPDNVEGMSLGPRLADGRQSLILVSDNNFNDSQDTQFIALGLTLNEHEQGGAGADRLIAGPGDDRLVGGAGVDVARFGGDAAAASIVHADDGSLTVTSALGGTDSLSGIELLRFDDRVLLAEVPSLSGPADPAFDERLYLDANPDVAAAVARGEITALDHYRDYGAHEGRDPNALFDERGYRAANPDVDASIQRGELDSGYQHYQAWGWQEGRDPSAWFDLDAYFDANPDIAQAGVEPLGHYLRYGYDEGRVVTADDDGLWG
ncbi:esterase-like activity of phytase family protein [Halomonas coralii]|uniref:esterase-like activity of phytase family protein n=1 Tax=Modicisalibacter sp. R2A 31.J TaxID=2831898 RepID=UPI001CCBF956|nr:esterase-like activity of phytase family protein [Modicisalibacter sp. R2A 31.J]MBZ9557602.1 esterase-like activity of phytase family protein [Modicisalibacter sp. R2A 31.J]